jgi:LysR family transcriptional regulator, nitrogen assimilation regulatory protein
VDTRHLKSFLRIADLRSISRAAESLGIAQPSLSQQLLRLEDEVGFKLFRRTARGVTVTEAGRIFQEHARHILRSTEQALEDVRQLNEAASGQVVFAMPHSISKLIGVALIESVMEHAPQVSVRLVEAFSGNIRGWLDAGKIDLGILHDRGSLRHLAARRLVSEEMFLIGPAGRFGDSAESAPRIAPEDLRDYPLIAPGPQHGLRNFLETESSRLGFAYRVSHEIDAVGSIVSLVSRGRGYSILPLPAVSDELAAGRLSVARVGDGTMRRTLCLVRNAAQVVTHASIVVEDFTIRIMTDLIEKGQWTAELEVAQV